MKILVLSDSHASLRFMRQCVRQVRPNAIVHLGDYYDDGQVIQEENPHLLFWQVPGNCDKYRCPLSAAEILAVTVCGVKVYMTHGHRHNVKLTQTALLVDARKAGAQIALFGHTHCAECRQEADGLWVMNPGTCGAFGGSAGLIETEKEQILSCRVIRQEDLEEML